MNTADRAALFDALCSASRSAVAVVDNGSRIITWNAAAEGIFGHTEAEALGRDLFQLLFRAQALDGASGLADGAFVESGCFGPRACTASRQDGSEVHVELTIAPAQAPAGHLRIVLARDLTREREVVEMFTVSEANFYNVVQRNRSGILVLDADGVVRFANPVAEQLLGREDDDLWGAEFGIPSLQRHVEVSILRADGSQGTAEMTSAETLWQGHTAYLVMLHDITDRKRIEEQVRHLAYHDALTGLPNRILFQERLVRALSRRRRNGNRLALLFIDLNGFKDVNDTFGHAAGDLLLKTTATRLMACVREADSVARIGGDEFTVILEQIHAAEDAERIAAKMLRVLGETMLLEDVPINISASIGYATAPADGDDAEQLVRRADDAMYAAKADPSSHIVAFSPAIYRLKPGREQMERALRGALLRQEMALQYQPQFRLSDGELVGLEALLRWSHPKLGTIAPMQFIPVLEETGLILDVGLWVFRQALEQLATWRARGLAQVTLAVNVSPRQLAERAFEDNVLDILQEHGLPAASLEIELPEAAVMDDLDKAARTLGALAEAGVSLVLDDFGTGYSALGTLRQLPISTVKIDRSMINALPGDDESAMLVSGLIAMLHGMNKTVVAEGVETTAQLDALRDYGCDIVQGWVCGHAADPEPITALLEEPGGRGPCGRARRG